LRQLEEVEDWLGITRIENNARGQATKVTYPDQSEVAYAYGSAGEKIGVTYPDGAKVGYAYDERGRLARVNDALGDTTYAYDTKGYLAQKQYPSGIQTLYAYTDKGQLASLTHQDNSGILDKYHYTYDIQGNKTQIDKKRRGFETESGIYQYGYDALQRLTEVTKDGALLRGYTYDARGNRSTNIEHGKTSSQYTYNTMNQLIARQERGIEKEQSIGSLQTGSIISEETYIYDKRGNLTENYKNGNLINQYHFGALNRLEKAVNHQSGEASVYQYNGLGHRVGKTIGSLVERSLPTSKLQNLTMNPTKQIEDTIDLTKQYHNLLQRRENNDTTAYTWDNNVLHAVGIGNNISEKNHYQYLQDELGSPIRLLTEAGIEQDVYGYDEFGQETMHSHLKTGFIQPFTYTGYQRDHVTNTYYAQAREYRAEVGRFVSEDAIKAGENWYIYCNHNPLMNIDPLGLEKIVISGGIYSEEKRENDEYYYEFIDAGLAEINQLNRSSKNENITWMIADHGWSDLNKSGFQKTADDKGINLVFVSNRQQVVNYLNYQATTNINHHEMRKVRNNDQITHLSVFSHGLAADNGIIALGYDYGAGNENLNLTTKDIHITSKSAFAKNAKTTFYSCNTGTAEKHSFAELWANRVGGVTIAYKGTTDYAGVADNSLAAKIARRLIGLRYGVSAYGGNPSLPVAGDNAERMTFIQECSD